MLVKSSLDSGSEERGSARGRERETSEMSSPDRHAPPAQGEKVSAYFGTASRGQRLTVDEDEEGRRSGRAVRQKEIQRLPR